MGIIYWLWLLKAGDGQDVDGTYNTLLKKCDVSDERGYLSCIPADI